MHTLVFNLTRFGDLLQTQPIISGLTRRGETVGLICLENFVSATGLLRDLAYVKALPAARLLSRLDSNWTEAAAAIWDWSEQALESPPDNGESGAAFPAPDTFLNLTTSLSVRLLTRLLALRSGEQNASTPSCLGFGLDPYGYAANSNRWATFLQASSKNRGCSPFNLVDLFWKTADLGTEERCYELRTPDAPAMEKAAQLLAEAGPDRPLVGFQLGASVDRRRWPVEYFARLGKMLEEKGYLPVLLGSLDEAELANRYMKLGGPGISLVGRTSLDVLAAALQRMQLLVSNDTGTMHLAAGLGRPIVAIFLATAQPWDTGPYCGGNICLEPDLPCHPCQFGKACPHEEKCRRTISPAVVFSLCMRQLEANAETMGSYQDCGSRVWLSEREENGFMGLASISGHDATDRVIWIRLQRHFYRHFLDLESPPPLAATVSSLSAQTHASITNTLSNVYALLGLLDEQSKVLELAPREALKKKFLTTWQRVQTLWESNPYFNVLSYLWMNEAQESGQNLTAIRAVILRYRQLTQDWLNLLQ